MRVLLCDDHVVFAESLAHLLRGMGIDVVATTFHPLQALDVLRRQPVDVCILDVTFGTESVIDSLADIRVAAPHSALLLLSGQVDSELVVAGRAAGVRGVADKRLPVTEIARILARIDEGEPVLPDVAAAVPRTRPVPDSAARYARQQAAGLTPRERQVLGALVCGQDTRRVARELGITHATARCHIQSVLMKLGTHSRLEAATNAVRFGVVHPETGAWLLPVS